MDAVDRDPRDDNYEDWVECEDCGRWFMVVRLGEVLCRDCRRLRREERWVDDRED